MLFLHYNLKNEIPFAHSFSAVYWLKFETGLACDFLYPVYITVL